MIFADKLIRLRKKSGWSQEELAEQMGVTRQSVSKWEGAQSIPDLEKMIKLSELFGVSTDFLLKDEFEEPNGVKPAEDSILTRRVTMEQANAFLNSKLKTSRSIAIGVFLCILSPICLILLGAMSEFKPNIMSENIAGGIGMIVMLIFIAAAVSMFILSGSRTEAFAYIDKEPFETEYGVSGMVSERREEYKGTHTLYTMIGVFICIISVSMLFAGVVINENNDLLMVAMLSVMLMLIAVGAAFLVNTGIIWESFAKLLQEGDFTKEKKASQHITATFTSAYWLIATALYLAYSLPTEDWTRSWIIWPVAAVIYPALIAIINSAMKSNKR